MMNSQRQASYTATDKQAVRKTDGQADSQTNKQTNSGKHKFTGIDTQRADVWKIKAKTSILSLFCPP